MADPTNPADISTVVSTYLDEKVGGAAQETRYSMTSAVAANPDYEAELRKVARSTGVPVDTVRAFPEEMKQQATLATFDFDGMAKQFPSTAAFLSGQENAAIAHDDTGNMTAVEKTLGVIGRGGRALASAAPSFAGGIYGVGQALLETAAPLLDPLAGTVLPGNPLRGVAAELAERRKQQDAFAKSIMPKGEGNIESGIYSGIQSIGQNAAALAAGVATGNPAIALGLMTAPVGGSAYGEARDKGVSPTGAAIFGASQAAIEFATEKIPMGRLLGDLKVGTPFYKMLARNIAAEVPGEQVATVLQDLNEWAILNPEKPFSAYVAERPGAAVQTLVATIVGSGGTVSVVRGVDAVMNRDRVKQEQAGQADQTAAAISELNTLAAASKVRERDSQTFDQFVASAAADGDVQDLFISAQTLAQSGIAEQVAAASPAVREQYATALETGTDIRIPLAEYAANIAPEGYAQDLVEHLKTDPQGFSQAEARTYMETRGDQLQKDVEAAMTKLEGDQTMTAGREAVQTTLLDQLNTARRFTPDVNQNYATLASSFYAVQAARLGITPEEMYQRYPLRIVAQQPLQGAVFNQETDEDAYIRRINPSGVRLPDTDRPTIYAGDIEGAMPPDAKPVRGTFKTRDGRPVKVHRDAESGAVWATVDGVEVGFMQPLSDESTDLSVAQEFQRQGIGEILSTEYRRANPDAQSGGLTEGGERTARRAFRNLQSQGVFNQSAAPEAATPQTETQAFKNWFADSKVVDADGKPLVVYRGGATEDWRNGAEITEFRSANGPWAGFFSSSKETANRFAAAQYTMTRHGGAPAGVFPVYLSMKNPLVVDAEGKPARDFQIDASVIGKTDSPIRQQMLEGGYDGLILRNTQDEGDVFVALRPEQIKSATGNRGTFDPTDPSILNQGEGQRGSFDPNTLTLSLLKGADLSTFLHEMGHFQLEVLADIASRPDAPAEVRADIDTLLKWFGVESTPETDALQTWNLMTLEEKREGHEQFARGFEAYLFEGKAPTAELRPIFQRFRAWLVSIYRQTKALDVQLTQDVRDVMDRMLATADQIQETEAVNSMGLLFETPEQAAEFGVEWKQYHDQGLQATQDAVTELEARSLRDMKWLTNAKARELRKLQRQSKAARTQVENEVRREVMSQPVYRAWQFLTGKDSGAAPIEASPAQSAYKVDLAAWETDRTEAYDAALAKVKAAAWDAAPESSATYPDARAKGMAKGQFMNRNGKLFRATAEQQAVQWETQNPKPAKPTVAAPDFQTSPELSAGKLKTSVLRETYGAGQDAPWRKLSAQGMTSDTRGLAPEYVAETFGFGSADEMVRKIAETPPPDEMVKDMTDRRMLEQFAELSTPEALEAAANEAVHNEARARAVATEQKALSDALDVRQDAGTDRNGRARSIAVLPAAARQFAADTIARLKVRDVKPAQYRAAEGRAGRDAVTAMRKGDLPAAAMAKRNQLINFEAARAAQDALVEVDKAVAYFRRVEESSTIDPDYRDQIQALLDRYELRRLSLREIDKRKSLAEWVAQQQEIGLEPEIPPEFMRETTRQSYRDMTVEELRGLRDTVRQIEKLGRLKHQLLTARDKRTFEEVRDNMAASVFEFSQGRSVDPRTPTTNLGRWFQSVKNFGAAHIKAATWVRVMDGGKAGIMWDYIVRPANERGDMETRMRAEATAKLTEIMTPVLKQGKLGGKGTFFPTINRSLNKESVLAIALNTGNQSNLQRLLGGENWTMAQVAPVLDTLTAQDWTAIQAVWDFFESYRPLIGAKQRRVYGTEPNWIDPTPVVTKFGTFKGGYYPVKYDPAASVRAEEHADAEGAAAALKGAYSAATTRRSFTKTRAEEVSGRPLLYTMQALYSGVNEVIHDLAWHEWMIDVNRLLKSEKVDGAIRTTYGPEAIRQLKTWRDAIAIGDAGSQEAIDSALSRIRQNVSAAGLGYNVMSAATQFLGAPQSMARIGAGWFGKGMQQYISNPLKRTREVNAKSSFMENRARTRYRELNELRNRIQGQRGARQIILESAYGMMMRMQQMIDVPTWLGGYERAIAEGSDEARAIALADQGVIDSQGGGQTKDLSAIERGGPAQKIYTSFYSFMNTTLNVLVARGMTHRSAAKTAADILLISIAPSMLMEIMKDLLTPAGDDDDDFELWKKLAAAGLDGIFGLVVLGREFSEAAAIGLGVSEFPRGYSGPSGLRLIGDATNLMIQANQGEFDDSFRKAIINLTGSAFGFPAAQANRSISGFKALVEGETQNPAALVFGFKQ